MPDPYVIEHRTNDRRGCLIALSVLALIVTGLILGAIVATGTVQNLLVFAASFIGVFWAMGFFALCTLGWQGLPHRIELSEDRIRIHIPAQNRLMAIDRDSTVRWSPGGFQWQTGNFRESLKLQYGRSTNSRQIVRAVRTVVPPERQTDWELFAFLSLVPEELRWSAYPPEAFARPPTRWTIWFSLVLTLVSVIAVLILSRWQPEIRFRLLIGVFVINGLLAIALRFAIRRQPPHTLRMRWLWKFLRPFWIVVGLIVYFGGMAFSGSPIQWPGFLWSLPMFIGGFGLLMFGSMQSDAAYRNYQRQLAAKVVPAWEAEWLKQAIGSPSP